MRVRRICLFGGPGCGKSTTAAWLFAQLKLRHVEVELVQEYVKTLAFEGRKPESWDQLWLLSKQMRREDVMLRNGVDVVVTDSPLLLSTCYAMKYNCPGAKHLVAIAEEFDETYPPLNIFIDRGGKAYSKKGRYQTEEEAHEMDKVIKAVLERKPHHVVHYSDHDSFLRITLEHMS